MEPFSWLLLAAFAFITGANDGGTLLTLAVRTAAAPAVGGLLVLAVSVVAVPNLLGAKVADTLANRLVSTDSSEGLFIAAVAVSVATLVVAVLTRLGRPTSLSLALIAGVMGAGFGGGQRVAAEVLIVVLVVAALAPLVGALLGWILLRTSVRLRVTSVAHWHRAAFGLQCLAYGANDGQKMLAVGSLALATSASTVGVNVAIFLPFIAGGLVGLRKVSGTLTALVPLRTELAASATTSAGVAVLASAAVGAPVSMTQSIAGGLVGSSMALSRHRVRWHIGADLALAWVLTLPVAALLAATVAATARVVT